MTININDLDQYHNLLQENIFLLPKALKKHTFINDCSINLEYYLGVINQLDESNTLFKYFKEKYNSDLKRIVQKLIQCVKWNVNGHTLNSIYLFNETMDLISRHLSNEDMSVASSDSSFYRVRSSSKKLIKEDLFHIPYELRKNVKSYRYSVPGNPCLYVADSINTCWNEIGRTSIDNLYATRIESTRSLLLFDLGIDAERVKDLIKSYRIFWEDIADESKEVLTKYLLKFLFLWPLQSVCSYVCLEEKNFKEEYIFPQLLTQWIKNDGVYDGIRYFSTKDVWHDKYKKINYAILTKTYRETGFCDDLISIMRISDSISLREVVKKNDYKTSIDDNPANIFKATEDMLNQMTLKKISNTPDTIYGYPPNTKFIKNVITEEQQILNDGIKLAENREYNHAIISFSKLVDADKKNYLALLNRSSAYIMINKLDNAIEDLKKIIKDFPDHIYALRSLAIAYEKKSQYELAISYIDKIEEIYSKKVNWSLDQVLGDIIGGIELKENTECYNIRGKCYMKLERFDSAITDFLKVINQYPEMVEPTFNLASCYMMKKDYSNYFKYIDCAITLRKNPDFYYQKFYVYITELNNEEKAIDCLREALDIDPNHIQSIAAIQKFL